VQSGLLEARLRVQVAKQVGNARLCRLLVIDLVVSGRGASGGGEQAEVLSLMLVSGAFGGPLASFAIIESNVIMLVV
jgi:hypothetical protein